MCVLLQKAKDDDDMGVGGASAEDAEADFMTGVCEDELISVSPPLFGIH